MCLMCLELQKDMDKFSQDLQSEMDKRKIPEEHRHVVMSLARRAGKTTDNKNTLDELRKKYWEKK